MSLVLIYSNQESFPVDCELFWKLAVCTLMLNQCLLTHDGGDCIDGGDCVCEERGLPLTVAQDPWGSRH